MKPQATYPLLLACFFLSGLAALVYETAWTREFAAVFGTSNLAVATVLAAYMGGLAAGAAVAARLAPRLRRPVLVYGLLELGIALAALAIPYAIQGSRVLYVSLFGGSEGIVAAGGAPTALFYLAASFVILLVPTSMMGATLPLLARHAVRSEEEIGRRIGVLYAVNTAGAVAGTLLAAFALVPTLGLRLTIWVAAGINTLVFLAAWALARRSPLLPPAADIAASAGRGLHPILLLIFLSGAVSFAYEILWTRLLTHVVGSTMYAFATMLGSFLIGIALGAAVASRFATSRERAAMGFGLAQLGIAGLSLAAYAGVEAIPNLTGSLRQAGVLDHWSHAAAAMLTLFPAALCIGATFPLAVRILARGAEDAGAATARVYAANTMGSIVGSLAAGFVLVPALGFGGTLAGCVALNLSLALLSALVLGRRSFATAGVAIAGMVVVALQPPETPWRVVTNSAIGRPPSPEAIEFYAVGRAATVLLLSEADHWQLRTNGLPEANIDPPEAWHPRWVTARWLGALPVLARPETDSMLVVGLGGGVAVENIPKSVKRIEVVELEQEVVAANRSVGEQRWRDPLADPRLRVHVNDARNALLLSGERFDAIVSQPSHPWSPGAALLYTREFFEIARDHLTPEGVVVQWMGLRFVDEELFAAILATLTSVFEHVRVYSPPPRAGVLFLASNAPLETEAAARRAMQATPEAFEPLGLFLPEQVTGSLLLDEAGARTIAARSTPIRDDTNPLQTRAGRVRPLHGRMSQSFGEHDPFTGAIPPDTDPFLLIDALPPARAARVAASLSDPVDRQVAGARVLQQHGKSEKARRELREALAKRPRHPEARAALLELSRDRIGKGEPVETVVALPLDDAEWTVVTAWQGSPNAARSLEPQLAAIPLGHPLGRAARWLRADWRLLTGERARALEVVRLADELLGDRPKGNEMLLRIQALAAAHEFRAALSSLATLGMRAGGTPASRRALQILRIIPDTPPLSALRAHAQALLQPPQAQHGRPPG